MKKYFKGVVLVILLALVIVSCGKSESQTTQSSNVPVNIQSGNKEVAEVEKESEEISKKSYKIDSSMQEPVFSTGGFNTAYSIPVNGGVEAKFTAGAPGQTIYYGLVDNDAYWAGLYSSWLTVREDGKKWSTEDLVSASVTTETSGAVKITEPGEYRAYAVAVEGKKSSLFSYVTVELKRSPVLNLRIENGELRNSLAGELYGALTEDMKDAVRVTTGPIPSDLLGETVYFQMRNVEGWADSEVWSQYVEPIYIDSPMIYIDDVVGGKEVEIRKPSISFRTSNVDPSEIHIYYTLDGSTPVPGESNEYSESFTILESGVYEVKAVAAYGKSVSEVAVGKGDYYTGSPFGVTFDDDGYYTTIYIGTASSPSVTVSGLVLRISASQYGESTFFKIDDGKYQRLDSNYILLDESYEGKTLYVASASLGNSFSEPVAFEIKTLLDFQEKYSDNSRQFGHWFVEEEYNQYNGKPTGEYFLSARFLMGGGQRYIYVLGVMDEERNLSKLLLSGPSSVLIPSGDTFVTRTPYSVVYNIDGADERVDGDFYNLNMNTFNAQYCLQLTAENSVRLFEKTASDEEINIIMTLQEEMSLEDALTVFATAVQYTNYDAVSGAMLEEIKAGLSEMQFIYSNKGYREAVEYYKKVTAK